MPQQVTTLDSAKRAYLESVSPEVRECRQNRHHAMRRTHKSPWIIEDGRMLRHWRCMICGMQAKRFYNRRTRLPIGPRKLDYAAFEREFGFSYLATELDGERITQTDVDLYEEMELAA